LFLLDDGFFSSEVVVFFGAAVSEETSFSFDFLLDFLLDGLLWLSLKEPEAPTPLT
jgi:hypothetical protein